MKRIEVVVLPAELDEVADALAEAGVQGMSVYEARVFGAERGRRVVYRGSSHVADCSARTKVELIVPDDDLPRVLEALEQSLRAQQGDDARVLVSDIVGAVRIRPGEHGALDHGPGTSLSRSAV